MFNFFSIQVLNDEQKKRKLITLVLRNFHYHNEMFKGSSINDVTVLVVNVIVTKALIMKRLTTGGWGLKNCPKLHDGIYGQPLILS